METSPSRIINVIVIGSLTFLGLYFFIREPTVFYDISSLLRLTPDWSTASIAPPLYGKTIAIHNGCEATRLYAVFGAPNFITTGNPAGLYTSQDEGENWSLVTELPADKLTSQGMDVTCGGSSRIVFVGSTNGLFKIDLGKPQADFISILPATTEATVGETITAILGDPWENNTVYVMSPQRLWQSQDAGSSWKAIPVPADGARVNSISLDYNHPARLYAGTTTGLFKTEDGGTTWEIAGKGLPTTSNIQQITWDPADPNPGYISVGIASNALPMVAKTYDQGESWIFSSNGLLTGSMISTLIADHDVLYALSAAVLNRSMDGGATWEPLYLPNLDQLTPFYSVWLNPSTHILYLIANGSLLMSRDDGSSWSVLTRTVNPVIHSVSINRNYYAGSNQGILFSKDGGKTWLSRNNGLSVKDIKNVTVFPDDPESVLAISTDGRLFRTEDGGLTWGKVETGTDNIVLLRITESPSGWIHIYAAAKDTGKNNGELLISENRGDTWKRILLMQGGAVTDMEAIGDRVYAVINGNELWQTTDRGRNWLRVVINFSYATINDLAVNADYSFLVVDGSNILRTQAGQDWQRVGIRLGQNGLQEIVGRPEDASALYLKSSNGVFYSKDHGDSWELVRRDTNSSLANLTIDPDKKALLATTASYLLIRDPGEDIQAAQKESLTKILGGWENGASQVLTFSQNMQMPLGTTLLIILVLAVCVLLIVLNIQFFFSFLSNTVEILILPDRVIRRINTKAANKRSYSVFFFVVLSCLICFVIFYFSQWLSLPYPAEALTKTYIYQLFNLEVLHLRSTSGILQWQWSFFLVCTVLSVLIIAFTSFNSVVVRYSFYSEKAFSHIFSMTFEYTCLVVSAWINLLILLSLIPALSVLDGMVRVIFVVWFTAISIRFIHGTSPLSTIQSTRAFLYTVFFPLAVIIYIVLFLIGLLRTWPWRNSFQILFVPFFRSEKILANASGAMDGWQNARQYLLAYALSLSPILLFYLINSSASVNSALYMIWQEIWAIWLFPFLICAVMEILSQWQNARQFPTRSGEPAQIFRWTLASISVVMLFVALNFVARCLGLLFLMLARWIAPDVVLDALYNLMVVLRFIGMALIFNRIYPGILGVAARQLQKLLGGLPRFSSLRNYWNLIRSILVNPIDVLGQANEQFKGSKPISIFFIGSLLLLLTAFTDTLRNMIKNKSLVDLLNIPHKTYIFLLVLAVLFAASLLFSYLFLIQMSKEKDVQRKNAQAPLVSTGYFQILPGYEQIVELLLFVIGLFLTLTGFLLFISSPGIVRFWLLLPLWVLFFFYSSIMFVGIANVDISEVAFSRLFFQSLLQVLVSGVWYVANWISRSGNPAVTSSIGLILEWQDIQLTKARADVYCTRMNKPAKAEALYISVLERSKSLKRLDFQDWNLPDEVMKRFHLGFDVIPVPESASDTLPLRELITSVLIELSRIDVSRSIEYINESLDDNNLGSWERLSDCRDGSVYALIQILAEHPELAMESFASMIPRKIPSDVVFKISKLLPDKKLSNLYSAFGMLVAYPS